MLNLYILFILSVVILGFYIVLSFNEDLINMNREKEKIIYDINIELSENMKEQFSNNEGGE